MSASTSPRLTDSASQRILRLLQREQDERLYGTVTVYYQDGRIERVEVKRTTKIADL